MADLSDPSGTGIDLDREAELFRELEATGRRAVRNEIIERYMGFAAHIAAQYSQAASKEDVRQVAMMGLVKAVQRFDPSHGSSFKSFAGPTIEGEVKRYFRDHAWVVRVPRSGKELHLLVRDAKEMLAQRLGRTATVDEIAEHLHLERDDVMRGFAATAAYQIGSIDALTTDDDNGVNDRVGVVADEEIGFQDSEDQQVVAELLDILPERERQIVELSFFENLSQREIASIVGVSQMHVSRLLRRSFTQMQAEYLGESAED